MSKIYVAASFPRRSEAKAIADALTRTGHEITSRWVLGTYLDYAKGDPVAAQKFATEDLSDVMAADTVVMLTGDNLTKGGRHTELGFAIATGKTVFIIGSRDQVFHYHPLVIQCETVEDLIERLDQGAKDYGYQQVMTWEVEE